VVVVIIIVVVVVMMVVVAHPLWIVGAAVAFVWPVTAFNLAKHEALQQQHSNNN